jgi:membrane fusion protein (multidrug efflux system)
MDSAQIELTPLPQPLPPLPDFEPARVPIPITAAAKPKQPSRAKLVLPVLVLIAAGTAGAFWWTGRGQESTDDAQIEGRVMNVSPRVPGQVAKVLVVDNQLVNEGDPLVEIDPADFQVRLEAARADLASAEAARAAAAAQLALTERNAKANLQQARGGLRQARAGTSSSSAALVSARADIDGAESRVKLAGIELDRVKKLRAEGALPQAELDAREAAFDQATAGLALARARLTSASSGIDNSDGVLATAHGRLLAAETAPQQVEAARASLQLAEAKQAQAQAALHLAELNRSYTTVRAPVRGLISRRNVEVGQLVSPERPLLALVPPDDVWVVANFKEVQVAQMKAGQAVKVRIDAYGRREFPAHIDSLASASGARFSLLPPDNSSGNFVKVVQRIPVLVRFDGKPEAGVKPGMSAFVSVRVD